MSENAPTNDAVAAVRQATQSLTAKYNRKYWTDCIKEARSPSEYLRALGDSGLLGLGVAEDLGGSGGGLREQVALIEEIGRAGIPAYSFLVANFVRHTLIHHGSAEQIAAHVPRTMTGETYTAFALTEPDSGTNSFGLKTEAIRDGDEWVINGHKCFISSFGEASQAMVVARTSPPEAARAELSLFMVELPAEGITFARQPITAGAPEYQYNVFLDDVRLPLSAVVGEPGKGTSYLFKALNSERILGAAMAIGLGNFALHKGVDYANARAPFGTPLGAYQAVAHPLARAKVQLDAAQALLESALGQIERGEAGDYVASACKLIASESANLALDATIQVHGGWAFDHELDIMGLTEIFRLLRVAPINNESVLNLVATAALGLPRSH